MSPYWDSNADPSNVQPLASCYKPKISRNEEKPLNILKQYVTSKQAWLTTLLPLNLLYRYSNLAGYHTSHFHHSHWKLLSVSAVLTTQLRVSLYIR
jgi:hypothetical protein